MNSDVRQYLPSVPEPRKPRLQKLHDLILESYPQATIDLSYRMPTYKVGDGWVAIANQKHYVSLYTCGAHHLARFREKYPAIKTGKGCITFRDSDPLPEAAIRQVIKHAIEHPKAP